MARRSGKVGGFTLVELLVVLVVIGVVVATIQLNLFSNDARRLRDEGERLAALLTAYADESVTSGRPLAVSFGPNDYRFWQRSAQGEGVRQAVSWQARPGDELFASRSLPVGMRIAEVRIRQRVISLSAQNPERVVFSPSGLHTPFSVLIALDDLRVSVLGDAMGNLRVAEDRP